MRMNLLERKRDRVAAYGAPLVPPTAWLMHDDVRSLSRLQAGAFGMTIMVVGARRLCAAVEDQSADTSRNLDRATLDCWIRSARSSSPVASL